MDKSALKIHCLSLLEHKIEQLNLAIKDAQNSANNETKSSAGDKHETSRAMAQLENERLSKQKNMAIKSKEALKSIPLNTSNASVTMGSLVNTSDGIFYIAIGLGKIQFQNKDVFVVPLHAPAGKLLANKQVGDSFIFKNQKCEILKIT